MFCFTSPLLVLGLILGFVAWRRWAFAAALEGGHEAEGCVVRLTTTAAHFERIGTDDSEGRRSYRFMVPVVEFQDASGSWVRVAGPERGLGRNLKVGDKVKMRYPVGEPQKAVVAGNQNYVLAGAIGVISLALLLSWLRLTC